MGSYGDVLETFANQDGYVNAKSFADMGVSINGGTPIAGWLITENPSING